MKQRFEKFASGFRAHVPHIAEVIEIWRYTGDIGRCAIAASYLQSRQGAAARAGRSPSMVHFDGFRLFRSHLKSERSRYTGFEDVKAQQVPTGAEPNDPLYVITGTKPKKTGQKKLAEL